MIQSFIHAFRRKRLVHSAKCQPPYSCRWNGYEFELFTTLCISGAYRRKQFLSLVAELSSRDIRVEVTPVYDTTSTLYSRKKYCGDNPVLALIDKTSNEFLASRLNDRFDAAVRTYVEYFFLVVSSTSVVANSRSIVDELMSKVAFHLQRFNEMHVEAQCYATFAGQEHHIACLEKVQSFENK